MSGLVVREDDDTKSGAADRGKSEISRKIGWEEPNVEEGMENEYCSSAVVRLVSWYMTKGKEVESGGKSTYVVVEPLSAFDVKSTVCHVQC